MACESLVNDPLGEEDEMTSSHVKDFAWVLTRPGLYRAQLCNLFSLLALKTVIVSSPHPNGLTKCHVTLTLSCPKSTLRSQKGSDELRGSEIGVAGSDP